MRSYCSPSLRSQDDSRNSLNHTRILHAISPPWLILSHIIWFLKGHFKPRMNMHFMILVCDGNIHLYPSAAAWLAPKPNRRFINYRRNFLPFRSAVVSRWSPDTLLRHYGGSASIAALHARPFAVDGGRAEGTESRKDVAMLEFPVSHHDEVTREPM